MREAARARRVVVKVGTNTLSDPDGRPDPMLLDGLAADIAALRKAGTQVLLVSSGAIGCGMAIARIRERPQDVVKRQALAALGQHHLMAAWQRALHRQGVEAAQVLVTHHTFNKRRSYLNLRRCIEELLGMGAVPIINENDTVSIREIDATFGDNDRLGALVAAKTEADLYVILSDVDGLYDKPPGTKGAARVERVERIDDKVLQMAGKAGRSGTGGMASKLLSAKHLSDVGIPVLIAYGRQERILASIMDPEGPPVGTWFDVVGHQDGKRRWLHVAHPEGTILVDAGAAAAIRAGNHLLPAGVIGIEGSWQVESVVDISHDGVVVARAVSAFSSQDLERCKGLQSEEVDEMLGIEGAANITRKGRIEILGE